MVKRAAPRAGYVLEIHGKKQLGQKIVIFCSLAGDFPFIAKD